MTAWCLRLQVSDFGLSLHLNKGTHVSGARHGTPLYMAPEVLQSGRSSKASDVYSMGVMMW